MESETSKREHRMDRNRSKGKGEDPHNVMLSAAGRSFGELLQLGPDFLRLLYYWLLGCQGALLLCPRIEYRFLQDRTS